MDALPPRACMGRVWGGSGRTERGKSKGAATAPADVCVRVRARSTWREAGACVCVCVRRGKASARHIKVVGVCGRGRRQRVWCGGLKKGCSFVCVGRAAAKIELSTVGGAAQNTLAPLTLPGRSFGVAWFFRVVVSLCVVQGGAVGVAKSPRQRRLFFFKYRTRLAPPVTTQTPGAMSKQTTQADRLCVGVQGAAGEGGGWRAKRRGDRSIV